jgi:hypothetical protein
MWGQPPSAVRRAKRGSAWEQGLPWKQGLPWEHGLPWKSGASAPRKAVGLMGFSPCD